MASETSSAARRPRPLSPHLQIYKLPISARMSILHRITGIALSAGSLLLVCWILAVAIGDQGGYARLMGFMGSWFGRLLLFGWTVALFYHLLNGIRHLFWDAGRGFDLATVRTSGTVVLAGSGALSLLVWIAAYTLGGR